MISLNKNVEEKLNYILNNCERLGCQYLKLDNGAHVVDMGLHVKGSFEGAKLFTEIELADLATVEYTDYVLEDGTSTLAVEILTSEPQLSCKYSFIAFYPLGKVGDICMIGSGPGRALAKVEEDYCFHDGSTYQDDADFAVICVQGPVLPDEAMAEKVAKDCSITPDKVFFLAHGNTCITASVQVAARIVEQTLPKIMEETGHPEFVDQILFSKGFALVAPVTDDDDEAMGKINDSLLYGGRIQFWVDSEDEVIKDILPKVVTHNSKNYGRLFKDMYLEAGRDYFKIDVEVHCPAEVEIYNTRTGNIFKAGGIREDIILKSFFNNKR